MAHGFFEALDFCCKVCRILYELKLVSSGLIGFCIFIGCSLLCLDQVLDALVDCADKTARFKVKDSNLAVASIYC